MSSNPTLHCFPAHFDSLPEVLASIAVACSAAGMSANVRRRVELVVEEAFANSIHHGYPAAGNHSVWLSTTMLPDGLRFVYQDEAPPFDPLQHAALPGEDVVGGIGRVLIKSLPRRAEYVRQDGRNILTLEFDLNE